MSVGRGATCHVTLVDPKIPDEAARLQMTSITEGAAVDQVTLECINHVEGFTLNNVQLHVNQPVCEVLYVVHVCTMIYMHT